MGEKEWGSTACRRRVLRVKPKDDRGLNPETNEAPGTKWAEHHLPLDTRWTRAELCERQEEESGTRVTLC